MQTIAISIFLYVALRFLSDSGAVRHSIVSYLRKEQEQVCANFISSIRQRRQNETSKRDFHIIVSHCQENLDWLHCDLIRNGLASSIHVMHQCSPAHPGHRRDVNGNLVPQSWNYGGDLKNESCIQHDAVEYQGRRESEAYLRFIVGHYDTIKSSDLFIFVQAEGMHEVRRDFIQGGNESFAYVLESILPSERRIGFLSLSGVVQVKHKKSICTSNVMSILKQNGEDLNCRWQEDYISPLRAMFAVSGKRILDIKYDTWHQLHDNMMTISQGDVHDLGVEYENSWAVIFKCFWASSCNKELALKFDKLKSRNKIFSSGSLECGDNFNIVM